VIEHSQLGRVDAPGSASRAVIFAPGSRAAPLSDTTPVKSALPAWPTAICVARKSTAMIRRYS